MNKEFVDYKTALALKELGFDEPCLKMAMSEIDIINAERTDEGDYPKNSHLFSGWVAIPTYSQAFRWFREKHKLYSPITDNGLGQYDFRIKHEWCGKVYDTYEEAESACLDKLIELVKNGNTSN